MRALAIIVTTLTTAALVGGCHLDPSTKPECLADDDCYRGHCREQVCYANGTPIGTPDVIYVRNPPGGSYLVSGNVIANDIDPDGDQLSIASTTSATFKTGTGYTYKRSDGTVEVDVRGTLPGKFTYRITDGIEPGVDEIPVTVAELIDRASVTVESGSSAPIADAFAGIIDTSPAALELVSPPAAGLLIGDPPNVTYVPNAGYCGTDSAVFEVHAASGTFEFVVTFEVGIVLEDEQQIVEFGTPTSIDVLANERTGLELVDADTTWASVSSSGDMLVVDPPVNSSQTYEIEYTARDSRGCEGKAALSLGVEFPTRVIVGAGLSGDAFDASPSDDGRYVVFTSADATLVNGDTNGAADVFVLDLATNSVERVSVATGGAQANESSTSPSISADGRYVAFVSRATNFTSQDQTAVEDVYVRDRVAGTTTLVSVSLEDGGSDRPSVTPHISADGTRVVFASTATRLTSNDSNEVMDVFVRDIPDAATQRVSVTGAGAEVPYASMTRPRISGNGRYVALSSSSSLDGSNSGGAFLVDTSGSAVSRIDASLGEVDIDDAGRFVIHADYQVTLLDRVVENSTNLMTGTFPSLSADGRYAVYADADRVLARGAGATVNTVVDRVGAVVHATPLRRPEVSGDGRWIVFSTSEWPGYQGRFVIVRVWNGAYAP